MSYISFNNRSMDIVATKKQFHWRILDDKTKRFRHTLFLLPKRNGKQNLAAAEFPPNPLQFLRKAPFQVKDSDKFLFWQYSFIYIARENFLTGNLLLLQLLKEHKSRTHLGKSRTCTSEFWQAIVL